MHRLSRSIVALAALSALTVSTAAGQPSSEPLALLSRLSDGSEIELPQLDRAIPSPISVLGYDVGSRFSHWREIRSYFEALTAASPRVTTWSYGSTYEDRPLQLVAISSPENLVRLDEIRQRNLALALPSGGGAMADDDPLVAGPVIAWLGYGVHGNEASSAEAAMAVAYILAAGGEPWSDLLRDVVVLIDPLANPDGRERYVHFYESRRGRRVDSLAESAEHHESWPGGRQNHYLVDLNRDWAWASQIETKWRLSEYRRWEPHVVVDLHEMSTDATYFFPPSAAPLNERIDRRTVDWLERFGRSNAAAFDARGWIYYSGETFDLYYPGYGDSYPSLRGAVGMTYEVAGHSSSGLAVVRDDGTRLTLPDRIARHTTSSLTTVRTAAENRHQLLTDFAANRRHPFTETARTYLWDAGEYESAWIARVLEGHGIVVERLAAENELRVRPVTEGAPSSRTFAAGSWVASTDQPLGSLLRVLMDLNGPMPEEFLAQQRERLDQNRPTRFFDITAWSLPLAGNVETWIMDGATVATAPRPAEDAKSSPQGAIGFLTPPSGLSGYRFAARLLDRGVHFRLALSPFTTGGVSYPAGTLFVPLRSGNGEGTEDLVRQAAEASEVPLDAVLTSFSEKGISLGSESMATVRPPRIGLVSGRGVSATSFGFLWHLLDRQVEAPHHLLAIESLSKIDLRGFDVLVLPDGSGYSESLGILGTEALAAWTRAGGLLVSIGDSVEWLQENELTEVVSWAPPEVDAIDDAEASIPLPGGRGSDPIERPLETPGAAVNTVISESHPLAVGVPRSPRVLIQGSTVLRPSGDPQKDLLTIDPEEPIAAGFAWPEARERMAGSLLVGTEDLGSGKVVVFLPAPCFRLFWRANTPLFLNAVLYGPSLRDRGVF